MAKTRFEVTHSCGCRVKMALVIDGDMQKQIDALRQGAATKLCPACAGEREPAARRRATEAGHRERRERWGHWAERW